MNKRLTILSPRWYMLLLWLVFIIYGIYLWSIDWKNSYYHALEPKNCVAIGALALCLELKFITISDKDLVIRWLMIPVRIIPLKRITSITIVQKANDERDDSARMLITIAPCIYRTDMTLTAVEFARQHLIKGIFCRIPKKNPEETIQKLKMYFPDMEIPYIQQ